MKVKVKLFATLARFVTEYKPGSTLEIELPAQACIADVVSVLKLPAEQVRVTFVNGRARAVEWRLEPGDEVGIFPPVGGG